MVLFALTFAALIHDVEHQGIPNRQLTLEEDRLAILHNVQSMIENCLLYVAFSELLQDEFIYLRNFIFKANINITHTNHSSTRTTTPTNDEQVEYHNIVGFGNCL